MREILSETLAEGQYSRCVTTWQMAFHIIVFIVLSITWLSQTHPFPDKIYLYRGKSKAKLTFGTMKANAWASVDLDMDLAHNDYYSASGQGCL